MLNISDKDRNIYYSQLNYILNLKTFFISFFEYLIHKIDRGFFILKFFTLKNIDIFLSLKFNAVAKLIWARGRLSRRIRYIFIFTLTLFVYLSGSVFQEDLVVEEKSTRVGYLTTLNGFFLGRFNLATRQGNAAVLSSPVEYVVKDGDTLVSLGKFYGISIESIRFANNLSGNTVRPGQILKIPRVEGTIHQVKRGDTILSLARRYNVPEQSIVDFNYIDEPYILTEGQTITIPNAKLPQTERIFVGRDTYDTSAYGIIPYATKGTPGTGKFSWPFAGVLSQGFSEYHPAVDIASRAGNILSADKGVVIKAGLWQGGYGNAVQIDHRNGYVTTYAHMSSINVSTGQEVDKAQAIGVVGSTGRSTGPHLHFTVQFEGRFLNPLSLFR